MLVPQGDVEAALRRYDDLLVTAARDRLAASARTHPVVVPAQASPSTTARTVIRIRAGLRQAVASLVGFASIG
ncbi:MAG: hypothetical protein AVDCRST_MAG70-2195 [uncultured Thermomicrobiales bacterium]|uniref:Uncharacterized protein n=1 Tax=uncultured Thermomicrobiales bacterium TaxID=1645740 RepID=A0A6J4V952_9BACT|nr:MAG: hypothetical protein AVDCRST_MAG70-2195 [uncultured Thermomicrobiales bacterium]